MAKVGLGIPYRLALFLPLMAAANATFMGLFKA
jgi:hypothetical protein